MEISFKDIIKLFNGFNKDTLTSLMVMSANITDRKEIKVNKINNPGLKVLSCDDFLTLSARQDVYQIETLINSFNVCKGQAKYTNIKDRFIFDFKLALERMFKLISDSIINGTGKDGQIQGWKNLLDSDQSVPAQVNGKISFIDLDHAISRVKPKTLLSFVADPVSYKAIENLVGSAGEGVLYYREVPVFENKYVERGNVYLANFGGDGISLYFGVDKYNESKKDDEQILTTVKLVDENDLLATYQASLKLAQVNHRANSIARITESV